MVTAERIRDKIAASKAKGMWMGGIPPLGYRPDGRSLAIVDEHASFVRTIFERYLTAGTVRLLAEQLDRDGLHAPQRSTASGRIIGARPLSRGQLYLMLKCRTYLGEVQHRDQVYAGLHPPIIERELWDQVQAQLLAHTQGPIGRTRAASSSPLAGKLVDGEGKPLVAAHASKAAADGTKRRYRYYVSHQLHHGNSTQGVRLPARPLERTIAERLAQLCDEPLALVATLQLSVRHDQLGTLHQRCHELGAKLRRYPAAVRELLAQVRVTDATIELTCDVHAFACAIELSPAEHAPATVTISVEAQIQRSGRSIRLVQPGAQPAGEPDPALVRLLLLARRWWQELRRGEIDVTQLAAREQRSPSYVTRIVRLAFLSPEVTRAILAGRQRAGVDVATLTLRELVPVLWSEQARRLLVD